MTGSGQGGGSIDWIELVTGYPCNCRCQVCPSALQAEDHRLTGTEMAGWLAHGRERGASGVWFGGGEPTLHPKLVPAIRRARDLGYSRVRLQTNGLRLAYADFTASLLRAGVTEFSLSVKGPDAELHEAMTRVPGSFDLLLRGLRNLTDHSAHAEADVLVTSRNMARLADVVDRFVDQGIGSFTFWLVSLHGLADDTKQAGWLPSLVDLKPQLQQALERAAARGARAVTLHTPPCVLDPPFRASYRHSGTWRLLVVTPGSEPFMAEDSPMEGGRFVAACERCASRPACLGLREDYLALHGETGIEAVG